MKLQYKIFLAFTLLFLGFVKLYSQCTGALSSYFPTTVNGITITQTYTGSVFNSGNTYTICGVVSGQTLLGATLPTSFTQTLTFSNPVNNIVYILNASSCNSGGISCESFSFTVTSGTLSCTQSGPSCPFIQSGNNFVAVDTVTSSAYITLSSTSPYTSLTVSGPGGSNGSFMALCSSSITGIKDNAIDKYLKIYPNPASSFLNIACSLQLATCSLQLCDALGNVIKTQDIKSTQETIDVSSLSEGIYQYKIISNNTVLKTGKIVVIR